MYHSDVCTRSATFGTACDKSIFETGKDDGIVADLWDDLIWEPQRLKDRVVQCPKQTLVVDCRFRLDDVTAGRRAYDEGHIEGAVYADLERDLSGPKGDRGGRHPLPDKEAFAALLTRWHVTPSTHVIAYDDGGEMAARLWWLLRYFGHDRASVLQGGIGAWTRSGYDLWTAAPDARPVVQTGGGPGDQARVDLRERRDLLATREDVQAWLGAGNQRSALIDSRARPRFKGDVEPLDPRAGHIPGAACFFFGDALSAPATYKSASDLTLHYASVLNQSPIVYCGSGVTACVNVLALFAIGVRSRLYAGSWSDWCQDEQNPVATGDS